MILTHANLQLEGYYVRELHCSVPEGLDETSKLTLTSGLHIQPSKAIEGSPFEPDCYVEAGQHLKDLSRFRVLLKITSEVDGKDQLLPYHFKVTLIGFFRAVGFKPTANIDPFLVRNAATILYSSARELLASVTGRGPFPALVLPTVSFIDLEPESAKAPSQKVAKKATAIRKKTARKPKRAVKK